MGWFIVHDAPKGETAESGTPYESTLSDDDLIRQAASGGQQQEPLNVFTSAPPASTGGNVDFDRVYEAAGISVEEHQRVTRTLDLLNSLPPETEVAVKKQIVMASLRAFGVPIDQIIESGAEEIQALEAYIRSGAKDTEQVTSDAEQRIRQYEEEIAQLRGIMQQRVDLQHAVINACNAKKLEVQKVLEFFGQDAVARVVRDSSKLVEPTKNEN